MAEKEDMSSPPARMPDCKYRMPPLRGGYCHSNVTIAGDVPSFYEVMRTLHEQERFVDEGFATWCQIDDSWLSRQSRYKGWERLRGAESVWMNDQGDIVSAIAISAASRRRGFARRGSEYDNHDDYGGARYEKFAKLCVRHVGRRDIYVSERSSTQDDGRYFHWTRHIGIWWHFGREIMRLESHQLGCSIDHASRYKWDNRDVNLRCVSDIEQSHNTE